ncbi:MAG TPA: ATP-binding protein [Caulobacteraceae bacterium]|nr:ATP-binding protein [Caulobacteraceae bacterium]
MPLFLQALGLVVATLVASQITAIAVIFSLPPPSPDIYTVSDVAQVLRTGEDTQAREGRVLGVRVTNRAPRPTEPEGRRRLIFRTALAENLGIAPGRIIVAQNAPRIVMYGGPRGRRPPPPAPGMREQPLLFGAFEVGIAQPNGAWLVVKPMFGIDAWQQRVFLVLGIALLAATPLAWWFSRRLAAPITALAVGAERLGRDPHAPPLAIQGPAEVTSAVTAFNEMQERLRNYVDYRTGMIAAIAHDLRTPLTRLRFRIEGAPDELKGKLSADIDQMEAMISATLSFVQDATRPRERTKLEIASLVETVMDEAAETGADAAVERADRVVIDGDPVALKRLVTNLVDNALKFGSRARGRVFKDGEMAIVEVDDNGPGVPEDQIERAFEPFHRLEGSRSRDTGGIGLGLAVVRAIARGHGGDVLLQNRAGGGLTARVSLPLGMTAQPQG